MVKRSSSKKRLILRQKAACIHHRSHMRWISTVHVATDQPTLPCPSHRLPLPEIPATNSFKNSRRPWYQICPTSCLSEAETPPTRRLRERRKSIDVWINSETRVEKILALLIPPALTAGLGKTCSRSRTLTITKKGITQGATLSSEKTYQKTSIGLGNLRFNDWQ